MSSILQALKKVEHVAPPEDGENALRRRIAESGSRYGSGTNKRPLVMAAGLAVVVLGAFLAFLFFPLQKTTGPGPDSGAALQPPAPRVETPIAALPRELPRFEESGPPALDSGAALQPPAPRVETPIAALPRELPRFEESGPPALDSGAALQPPPSRVETPIAALPRELPPLDPGRVDAPAGPATARVPAARPAVPAVPPALATSPLKEPEQIRPPPPVTPLRPLPSAVIPDFRLEGIVWSDSPGTRFAMIDGQIVRQGGTIQEFRVIRIAEDHVLIQSRDGRSQQRLTVH